MTSLTPRLRDRLAAHLHAHALDAELAGGARPDSTPALAVRASALSRPSARADLARSLNHVVREAGAHRPRLRGQVPVLRSEILAAAAELGAVARRLVAPGAIAPGGVAAVRLLLSDGRGPLYLSRAGEDLRVAAVRLLEALGPVRTADPIL